MDRDFYARVKICRKCRYHNDIGPCRLCKDELDEMGPFYQKKIMSFNRLNGLTPNLYSCTKKVFEEIGELMQCLGKNRGESGEYTDMDHNKWVHKTIGEALDGAQSIVTLIHVLAEENNIDIAGEVAKHEDKLRRKGYLV